jgi:hypothetical protein
MYFLVCAVAIKESNVKKVESINVFFMAFQLMSSWDFKILLPVLDEVI